MNFRVQGVASPSERQARHDMEVVSQEFSPDASRKVVSMQTEGRVGSLPSE